MAEISKEKEKALELALSQIEKTFGKGAIMKLGEMKPVTDVDVIPTGAISLDIATGIGGIPRGKIVEIFGPEGCGKTTLGLHIIAEAQKQGGIAAFIDAEHALDPEYAKKIGVNIENLYISQPDNGEQALEICEALVRSAAVDVIIIDSVAALVPRAELEGEMGEAQMGLQARLMSQALRKLTGVISKSKTAVVFVNQIREKIGVLFGSPETTPGGRALKFYASLRIDIRKKENIKQGENNVGLRVKFKVVKNKMAPPFQEAECDIIFGEGISKESSIFDIALTGQIIEKAGSWFSYKSEKIAQGRENVIAYLKNNPKILNEIEEKIKEKFGIKKSTTSSTKSKS
jgi:recombination protein RecA